LAKRSIGLCLALCLVAGIFFTWPLAPHYFSTIPYTLKPIPGFEKVPLIPGDHLQTYYWFWLLSDNLWGHSALFSNPYEFNGPLGPMSTVYANFPFSLLYVALLPLGPVGAYNGLILLSFLISGLSMFLLARTWVRDDWAALLAGLVFAVVPYRVSHIAGGQLFGYVIFLLPLCLFFVEKTLRERRWIFGWAAGACLILMSLMEPHTSFLTALTLGVYIPSRILLIRPLALVINQEEKSIWPGLAGVVPGGMALAGFLWIKFGVGAGLPLWHPGMTQALIPGLLSVALAWFYLSALMARLTTLSFSRARDRVGKAFCCLIPLGFYALKLRWPIPRLGLVLPLVSLALLAAVLLALWWKNRDPLPQFDGPAIKRLAWGVGLGLAAATAYLLHIRNTVFLPSLAGKGRSLQEVLLFSPRVGNLFFWRDINQERFTLLGWGLLFLALLGCLPLLKKKVKDPGFRALSALMAFGAAILTLGPTLPYFPLYEMLYRYFPFFNYPRVPARFVMVGFIFLGLLAASALARVRGRLADKGGSRLSLGLTILIIGLVLVEYHPRQPMGLSLMKGENRIYQAIRRELPKDRVVLELPIWPGDSHQSSAYEYTVTRTAKPMVNGYAPVVVRDYIKQVFWPLYPMDQGELGKTQKEELDRLRVGLITFHDNPQIFTEKVSPFPARLALRRLTASPALKFIEQDQDVFLFRPRTSSPAGADLPGRADITSPITAVFYVNGLPLETGSYQFDPLTSGYNLLMEEKALAQGRYLPRPGARGNVVQALPGRDRPGFLTLGTQRFFPSGKYSARFRMRVEALSPDAAAGFVQILQGPNRVIAQKSLTAQDFREARTWTDIPLEFDISQAGEIGFRVYFSGKAALSLNMVLIGFADRTGGPGSIEAEDLFRQTGTVVSDSLASGREAVLGKAGFHPPLYLTYGPYRTLEPGRYRAKFFLRLMGPSGISAENEAVSLEVATDMGKRIFNERKIKIRDLSSTAYRGLEIDFTVPFRCEAGFRVKFAGKANLLVDRITVE
jgi:hypothetical protein